MLGAVVSLPFSAGISRQHAEAAFDTAFLGKRNPPHNNIVLRAMAVLA
jgi:hypothetical protein